MVQTVDGADQRTEYEYDELGNLVVQRDANGHETRFEYDGLGRRTATVLPLGQRSETTYDAVGTCRDSTTDFNGDTIIFEYDDLDRLITKDFPAAPDTSYHIHADTASARRSPTAAARRTYEYDARDRLVSRTDPDGSQISYTYDAAGNRTSVTTRCSAIQPARRPYTFDEQNRMKTVTDPEGGADDYVYDLAGRLARTDLPNNTFETRAVRRTHRLMVLESARDPGGVLRSATTTNWTPRATARP